MLAQLTQNISPAFNTLCVDRRRSAIAIVSIIIGSTSVILLVSAFTAFQQNTQVAQLAEQTAATALGGGSYQAKTTNTTFATENTLFTNYRSLNAIEDMTALMTMAFAFVIGSVALLTVLVVGLHFAVKAFQRLPKLDLSNMIGEQVKPAQFLLESAMLTIVGSAIGSGIAFISAGYLNQLLNTTTLQIHGPSIITTMVIMLIAVVVIRTQEYLQAT